MVRSCIFCSWGSCAKLSLPSIQVPVASSQALPHLIFFDAATCGVCPRHPTGLVIQWHSGVPALLVTDWSPLAAESNLQIAAGGQSQSPGGGLQSFKSKVALSWKAESHPSDGTPPLSPKHSSPQIPDHVRGFMVQLRARSSSEESACNRPRFEPQEKGIAPAAAKCLLCPSRADSSSAARINSVSRAPTTTNRSNP